MYFYDDMVVGPSQQIPTFEENIDYLEYVPASNTGHYLHDNINLINFIKYMNKNPEYKIHNAFLYQRLSNICWRRLYKNFQHLPEVNPFVINWDKNSDITWLFGPKIIPQQQEEQQQEEASVATAAGSLYSCTEDDNLSVSSLVSDSSINSTFNDEDEFSSSFRKNSTISSSSSYYDEDEDDDYNWNLKSILKKDHKEDDEYLCIDVKHHQRKKVSFNYIVNTREIINGISVDYDFLDHDCL